MKKLILFLSLFLTVAVSYADSVYSLTCFESSQKKHTVEIHKDYVYLDGDIFLYKDDQSTLPIKSRATHSLFNDDDLDLVVPNSFLSGNFTQEDVILIDYESLENYPLNCSVKSQSNP